MNGVYNTLLNIDLTGKQHSDESTPDSLYEQTLGGKGLAARLLLERNPPGVDPLSPENLLILAIGPACGFPIWGANRYAAFTKSPLTNVFSESYAGGKAFQPFSKTGYDAILLNGAAEQWCYLEISPGRVAFHPADRLLGKDALETEKELRQQHPGADTAVLTIGPAGENLVRYAYVNNDQGRCLGRTGVGAVLGSKKVKALVLTGDREKQAHDPELLKNFRKALLQVGKDHPSRKAYQTMGTSMMVDVNTQAESFPARYWQQTNVDHVAGINSTALHRELTVRAKACGFCFLACTRDATVNSGRHQGLKLDGPEYETIYTFGGLNMVADIREIAYLNDLCDRLGMDTISAGNVTAFAIEAYKRGKIDFDLDYGQVDRIAELLQLIAHRQGIGNLLAEGTRRAAAELGLSDIAVHVKGLEPAGYDPRRLEGMGLGYAVSDRGACHLRTTFYKPELSGMIDPQDNNGKAKLLIDYEDRINIYDSLILCRFFRDLIVWDELATIIKGTMGIDVTRSDLESISRNIALTVREFNLREGMTPADDQLPELFYNTPVGSAGYLLDREKFRSLLDDYYQLRGY